MAEQPGQLAAALVAAQSEMPTAVERDGVNPHFGSRFTTLDALIKETRPHLSKHGLAISQWPVAGDDGQPALITRLEHVSGEARELAMPLYLGKADMQAFGAAITYARRYAWAAVLGVASDEDDDHQAASSSAAEKPKPAAKKPAVISDAQRERLFTIATKGNVPTPIVRETIKRVAGVESSKQIPRHAYDAVVLAVEAAAVNQPAGDDPDADIPF